MAIRFACPACQQPLEIDDGWAGQSVACPYCRRVVTAPQSSTWPSGGFPMANPARPLEPTGPMGGYGPPPTPGFAPPPPPMGYATQTTYAPRSGSTAGWALGLTITGAALLIGLMLALSVIAMKAGVDSMPKGTPEEQQRAMQELLMRGGLPHTQGLSLTAVAAMLTSIGGLTLAVRALVRQEGGRGMAIAACILGGLFLFCQMMMLMALITPHLKG